MGGRLREIGKFDDIFQNFENARHFSISLFINEILLEKFLSEDSVLHLNFCDFEIFHFDLFDFRSVKFRFSSSVIISFASFAVMTTVLNKE